MNEPITEISYDAIHDDAFQGPRAYYAFDGREDSTCWVGPCASLREAIEDYLDEHYPEDGDDLYVTLGKPLAPPRACFDADVLVDRTCDEDWPEGAVEILARAVDAHGKSLEYAVEDLVRSWCDKHAHIDEYWHGYGRSLETTCGEARRWLMSRS